MQIEKKKKPERDRREETKRKENKKKQKQSIVKEPKRKENKRIQKNVCVICKKRKQLIESFFCSTCNKNWGIYYEYILILTHFYFVEKVTTYNKLYGILYRAKSEEKLAYQGIKKTHISNKLTECDDILKKYILGICNAKMENVTKEYCKNTNRLGVKFCEKHQYSRRSKCSEQGCIKFSRNGVNGLCEKHIKKKKKSDI